MQGCLRFAMRQHDPRPVNSYDPDVAPAATDWLALDEQERIQLAETYHWQARIKVPNAKAHAAFHAIVENQVAEGLESVVRAMTRLTREGLSRHDAIHAIGSVLVEHLSEAVSQKDKGDAGTPQSRYDAAVERITAKEWYRQFGPSRDDG